MTMPYADKPIPRETALECLGIARRLLGDEGKYVELYEPGHEGAHWSIKGELNTGDWPYQLTQAEGAWPRSVFVDAIDNCALGLYPA